MIIALNHMKCDFLLKLLGEHQAGKLLVSQPPCMRQKIYPGVGGWEVCSPGLGARLMDTPQGLSPHALPASSSAQTSYCVWSAGLLLFINPAPTPQKCIKQKKLKSHRRENFRLRGLAFDPAVDKEGKVWTCPQLELVV